MKAAIFLLSVLSMILSGFAATAAPEGLAIVYRVKASGDGIVSASFGLDCTDCAGAAMIFPHGHNPESIFARNSGDGGLVVQAGPNQVFFKTGGGITQVSRVGFINLTILDSGEATFLLAATIPIVPDLLLVNASVFESDIGTPRWALAGTSEFYAHGMGADLSVLDHEGLMSEENAAGLRYAWAPLGQTPVMFSWDIPSESRRCIVAMCYFDYADGPGQYRFSTVLTSGLIDAPYAYHGLHVESVLLPGRTY